MTPLFSKVVVRTWRVQIALNSALATMPGDSCSKRAAALECKAESSDQILVRPPLPQGMHMLAESQDEGNRKMG